jgi:hypothetical protein
MNPPALQDVFADFLLDDEEILWTGKPEVSMGLFGRVIGVTPRGIVLAVLGVVLLMLCGAATDTGGSNGWLILLIFMAVAGLIFSVPLYLQMRRRYHEWYVRLSTYAITNWRILYCIDNTFYSVPIALLPYMRIENSSSAPNTITIGLHDHLRLFNIADAEEVFRLLSNVQAGRFAGRFLPLIAGLETETHADTFSHLLGRDERVIWMSTPQPAQLDRWRWLVDSKNQRTKNRALQANSYAVTNQRVMIRYVQQWVAFPMEAIIMLALTHEDETLSSVVFNVLAMTAEPLSREARRAPLVRSLLMSGTPSLDQIDDGMKVFRLITQLQRERLRMTS